MNAQTVAVISVVTKSFSKNMVLKMLMMFKVFGRRTMSVRKEKVEIRMPIIACQLVIDVTAYDGIERVMKYENLFSSASSSKMKLKKVLV